MNETSEETTLNRKRMPRILRALSVVVVWLTACGGIVSVPSGRDACKFDHGASEELCPGNGRNVCVPVTEVELRNGLGCVSVGEFDGGTVSCGKGPLCSVGCTCERLGDVDTCACPFIGSDQ